MNYRPDIDGLRAVAILSVLAFHAGPAGGLLPGGLAGVDIFFVISGYLITRIITTELDAHRFSFAGFYARRVLRIFPALIVVMTATFAAGWFLLLPDEFRMLGRHIATGALFVANFAFWNEAGYFDAAAELKPLLHLWSLGIEEQFYLVWPQLLWLCAWGRLNRIVALATIALASFALSIFTIGTDPAAAFYSPLCRGWELAAGGLLACIVPNGVKRPAGNVLAAAGFTLIATGLAMINPATAAFPGWLVLLPVLGTCCLIAAGADAWINRTLLASPIMVGVGLISYALYLWHWPLIVFSRMLDIGHPPAVTAGVAIALAFVLAIATYLMVERPVRRWRSMFRRPLAWSASGALATLAAAGLVTVGLNGIPERLPTSVRALFTAHGYADGVTPVPLLGSPGNARGPLIVTWGDSHAGHLHHGLQQLQREREFRLASVDCASIETTDRCKTMMKPSQQRIAELRPDIVIISVAWIQYSLDLPRIEPTIEFLASLKVPRVVLVGPAPYWPEPPRMMLAAIMKKSNVLSALPDRLQGFHTADRERIEPGLRKIAARHGLVYVSLHRILCNDAGCLVRLGSSSRDLVQVDNSHFGANGSWHVVSQMKRAIFDEPPLAARSQDAESIER